MQNMAASNTTLASLWVDEASGSPIKTIPVTPSKLTSAVELKDDVLRFYKDSGLEPVAREAGLLDANGELAGYTTATTAKGGIQMIAVPIQQSPGKATLLQRQGHTVLGTPQRVVNPAHILAPAAPKDSPAHHWQATAAAAGGGGRKRPVDVMEADYPDNNLSSSSAELRRLKPRLSKGLRHFSMKVCERVQKRGKTSYSEVADDLVLEMVDQQEISQYDQKNIRRRVYDALNVLMAMNIISKEKKEIKWIGLPTNSAQEVSNLEMEKKRRIERIKHKTQQLKELILQQIAFKSLVTRNREHERVHGTPASNSAIQLPYIIVNTSKKTVIDCSISNDKYEYLFNFDNTFEIHDDIEVLKRMGMAFGLEKNSCRPEDIKKAVKMVPKALEPYVLELANPSSNSAGTSGMSSVLAPSGLLDVSMDAEVAMATRGLSRQSSVTSYSRDTPDDDDYSDDSDSNRSSPVDIT